MTTPPVRRTSLKDGARLKYADHARLWRLVEGAVVDALKNHPDYVTESGKRSACRSITKRVVGQIVGHANETLRRGRLGDCSAEGAFNTPSAPSAPVTEGQEPPGEVPLPPVCSAEGDAP